MSAWPVRTVGEVVKFLNARRVPVKASDRAKRQGPFPYYGASGIVDWVDDFLFDGRYLLVSEDGENLRSRKSPIAFTVTGRFWVNNHAHILDEGEPGIIDYLSRALNRTDLSAYITGAAQPKLNKRTLEQVTLPIPPISERLEINSILNALDDKIELNRRTCATLEAMARALFRSWFVDFDPVHAKAAGEAPAHMDPATAALFPDRFGEDGLPEGWRMAPLSSLCIQKKDGLDPRQHVEQTFDHYSLPAFDAGAGPIREPGEAIKSQKLRVPSDAILFSRLNPSIPRIWWARTSDDVFASVASTEFLVAVARRKVDMPFLYSLMVSDEFRGDVIARVTGTSNSHQRVKPASVLEIEAVAATPEVRAAYGALTASWFDRIKAANHENRTLDTLRDTLLPKLMSGELRVREAERQVAEVA